MKKVIVTGATGFIGSWLTLELLNNGYEVTVIVRKSEKLLKEISINKNVIIIENSLEKLSANDFKNYDYDAFYNLAWAGVSPECKDNVLLQIENITSMLNALHVCCDLRCRKFISTGTVAEYSLTSNVMDLNARSCPNDIYGAAKASARYFLEVEAGQLKQPFNWIVIPSTFGERRIDNNIVTYTIKTLLNGDEPLYGNLEQMWDFLYVSEVARAIRMIGEKGKDDKVYGIGSGQYKPLKNYISTIRDIINPALSIGIGKKPNMSNQSYSSCVNNYDLIKDTGFQPQISFEEGIRRTVDYWRHNSI